MCRVCLKRPEVPDDRFGRCEICAKSGRSVYRFRLGPTRNNPTSLDVKAGELSPRAMRDKLKGPLTDFSGHPSAKGHLGLHEVEVLFAKTRVEAIRVAPNLAEKNEQVMAALHAAAERTDASW